MEVFEDDEQPAEATVEEANVVPIGEDDDQVASFLEPGQKPEAPEGPSTPSADSLALIEDVVPDEMEQIEGVGQPRRAPHADELLEALGLDVEEPVTPVPPIEEESTEAVSLSSIRGGLTYVRILFDSRASRYLYEVIEPPLSAQEAEDLAFLRETLVQTMQARDPDADVDWRSYLRSAIEAAIEEHGLSLAPASRIRIHYYLERDFLGYGPIDVMMQDPMVEDISCDGPDIPIYVFHRDHESTRTNVRIADEDHLDSFVRSLAQRSGRHISIAEPMLDATLPDTSRLQATLSKEVTTRGSSFTIRRFRADPLTAPDLVRLGTISARMAAWFWLAVEAGAPMLVTGGTASGKTTTLSSMTQFIPPAKKVVTIEDTREFSLVHENWIASLTRSGGFGEGEAREIDMYQLLRTALRQRPEFLVVGEVRGSEAQTLFQAMATGHATYSTMHADSITSAVYRLENPPIDVPRMMLQTLDAVAVQGQTRVDGDLVRRVVDVTEIVGIDDKTGDLLTNQVYAWNATRDTFTFQGRSNILEELRRVRNASTGEIEEDWARRTRLLEWMVEHGIRHISDVSHVIAAYYADPDRVMERIGDTALAAGLQDDEEGAASQPPASEGASS